jgi:hypothetical protein
MSINLNAFEVLCQQFPTWPQLKTHFESEDGVGLRVVEQGDVAVIRYEKNAAADPAFRSVVWDTVNNRPLCVAPFRANQGFPPCGVPLTVEDFADGFMMNAWVSGGVLQLATRTRVGGTNKFYSAKTFGELFNECLTTTPLKTLDALQTCLEGLRVDVEGTSAFASFVLQHPEHRVVSKFASPGLYVIHTGYVTASGTVHISERSVNWPQALAGLRVSDYPSQNFQKESDPEDMLRRTAAQRGWRWQGLTFKDGTGARWRLRTPTYTMLRQLRGAESTSLERFFRLRGERQVVDYLKHYGEERDTFWEFEQALRARTADIMTAYTDVHKAHTRTFKDLPEALQPAVYLLHVLWRDELRAKGFSVRLQNAIEVVNGLRSFEKKRLMEAAPYVAAPVTEAITEAVAEV